MKILSVSKATDEETFQAGLKIELWAPLQPMINTTRAELAISVGSAFLDALTDFDKGVK